MAVKSTGRVFRFGPFEADEATGQLRKHGVRIKLHGQPFQVLVCLLAKPGEVVTREELQQLLWRDQTFVDFDHGLNTAMNKLRQALGDSAGKPQYVETIPGKGYRFLATAVSSEESAASKGGGSQEWLAPEEDLPQAPRQITKALLLLVQATYLAFYLGALGNLTEIREIFADTGMFSPELLMAVLVATAAAMIPVRLFLATAVAFDYHKLAAKFTKLFPALFVLDILWALSPFLLIHHINAGLALGMAAALVYLPFAQRSLVLMYGRRPLPLGRGSV
jgi:DNA-binding winged helix-turn-helix (wHTH) protein